MRLYSQIIKPLCDKIAAFSLLLLASPILFAIAALLRLSGIKSVLFIQERAGFQGSSFRMLKFRTMRDPQPEERVPQDDWQRITSIGKILRRWSLDELPQLWNILIGDMTFVGPRPLLVEYNEYYSMEQKKRLLVKPGLTGWAQVNGRDAISWEAKFKLDGYYVANLSLKLDVQILLKTLQIVLSSIGNKSTNETIQPKFTGSSKSSNTNKLNDGK